jgi:capsular polysaccharide biosynthesis protein
MTLGRRVVRRLGREASVRGLIPFEAGPAGVVPSLHDWTLAHRDHCGARWVSSSVGPEPSHGEPRTISAVAAAGFEAAAAHFQTWSPTMVADTLDVAVLPHGLVVGRDGLVMTHDALLARESAWDDEKLRASGLPDARRLPRAQPAPGEQATVISQWCQAYYHWITDVLPRLAVLEVAGCSEVALVVPEDLTAWQRKSLELLGASRLTPYGGSLRADVLLWPRPVATPGHTPRWACNWIRERLLREPRNGRRRLYLTRRSEQVRRVANEADVWAMLEPMGFEMIDAGTLSLDRQIDLFADAAVVVSPHGGALTNILFAHRTLVVELFESGYVNPCYYVLADRCEHDYWYLIGPASPDGNVVVDVPQLIETLAASGLDVAGAR